jgi:hypothetical protein
MKNRGVVIVRKLFGHLAHGGRVGGVEHGAVGLWVGCVAHHESRDQRALVRGYWTLRARGKRLRLLGGREGRRHRFLGHREIDVGAEHQGFAPVTHRAIGIAMLRLAERAARFVVVEAVTEPKP